jgi:hypothetical protein
VHPSSIPSVLAAEQSYTPGPEGTLSDEFAGEKSVSVDIPHSNAFEEYPKSAMKSKLANFDIMQLYK